MACLNVIACWWTYLECKRVFDMFIHTKQKSYFWKINLCFLIIDILWLKYIYIYIFLFSNIPFHPLVNRSNICSKNRVCIILSKYMRKDDRDENQYLYGNCKKQRKRKCEISSIREKSSLKFHPKLSELYLLIW